MVRILFCFLLLIVTFNPAHAQTALVSGETASGALVEDGTATYTFTGTLGQAMILQGSASYNVAIEIFKPTGGRIAKYANHFSIDSLPETGTYTIIISTNGGQSGPVALY